LLATWLAASASVVYSVDLRVSGVTEVDLRWSDPELLDIRGCGLIRRVMLPRVFRGRLNPSCLVSMCSLSFGGLSEPGGASWLNWPGHGEVRYSSLVGDFNGAMAFEASNSAVLGEVVGWCRRAGRPSLPV
jgi:hypothetical protein